jgi:rare lipoprotein A (peptidoglycan hydrolase)
MRWLLALLSMLGGIAHDLGTPSPRTGLTVGRHNRKRRPRPMLRAIASWYYDQGQTASGWHAFYGAASLTLPFGTRVRFCFPAWSRRCVLATIDDRGPYVPGRSFDLDQNIAAALGFTGVQTVGYRIGG